MNATTSEATTAPADGGCNCMARANAALAQHNTRIEQLFSFGDSGNELSVRWPIATVQIERGRGKKKAMKLCASFCPLCGADLAKAGQS